MPKRLLNWRHDILDNDTHNKDADHKKPNSELKYIKLNTVNVSIIFVKCYYVKCQYTKCHGAMESMTWSQKRQNCLRDKTGFNFRFRNQTIWWRVCINRKCQWAAEFFWGKCPSVLTFYSSVCYVKGRGESTRVEPLKCCNVKILEWVKDAFQGLTQ